jgi:hypothetical protein
MWEFFGLSAMHTSNCQIIDIYIINWFIRRTSSWCSWMVNLIPEIRDFLLSRPWDTAAGHSRRYFSYKVIDRTANDFFHLKQVNPEPEAGYENLITRYWYLLRSLGTKPTLETPIAFWGPSQQVFELRFLIRKVHRSGLPWLILGSSQWVFLYHFHKKRNANNHKCSMKAWCFPYHVVQPSFYRRPKDSGPLKVYQLNFV